MKLTKIITKNIYLILVIIIIISTIFYLYTNTKESFQSSCDMSYCADANYEVTTDKSGKQFCLMKCNRIHPSYVAVTSDGTICKHMSGNTFIKTVSRNFNSYSKKNFQNNNSCQTCPTGYTCNPSNNTILASPISVSFDSTACKYRNGTRSGNICLFCPISKTVIVENPRNKFISRPTSETYIFRPTPVNNICDAKKGKSSYR